MNAKAARAAAAAALVCTAAVAAAAEIRFYKLNRHGQQVNILFVRNTDKPGCHAFALARDVHRVAVVGFEYCELFSSRDCEPGTEIPARWKGKRHREAVRLTPGSRWVLMVDGHVEVRSWNCRPPAEPGQISEPRQIEIRP